MNYRTMHKLVIIILIVGSVKSLDLCGDWIQFKDIKCLKALGKIGTEEEALGNCTELDKKSSLISIHSEEEQEFLNNILNKFNNIAKNSWIGMKYMDKNFKWIDGSSTSFSNWDQDALKDGTEQCVQMSLLNATLGKWDDVSCKRSALIVCQKPQELSLTILRNIIEKQQTEINTIKANQNVLVNPIPIGFLYTQIKNQSDPQQLWPSFKWQEVTKDYAGLFFRAEGGESLPFGQIQQANQSWISDMNYLATGAQAPDDKEQNYSNPFKKSEWTIVDPKEDRTFLNLHFFTTDGEVRPKNTAIKIWKRVQ